MSGKFIVIEGIDGSGTSTQSKAIAQALAARPNTRGVMTCFQLSDGSIGRIIREMLSGERRTSADPKTERRLFAMLFAADRHDHLFNEETGIVSALNRGEDVVCAPYVLSSLAYECEDSDELDFVRTLNEEFPLPDLTLYLDCPVDVALNRIHSTRENIDVFENRDK